MRFAGVWLGLLILSITPAAMARTLIVPDEFPTINLAKDAGQPGDTIQIKSGTYNEAIRITSNINIEGENADQVIIRGHATAGPVLALDGVENVTISGCTFEQTDIEQLSKSADPPSAVAVTNSTAEFRQCHVQNSCSHGIYISGASKVKVTECHSLKNAWSGICADSSGTEVTVTNCELIENKGDGVYIINGAQATVQDNVCSQNVHTGIEVQNASSTAMITKNTVSGNGCSGIRALAAANATINDNTCSENKLWGIIFDSGARGSAERNECRKNGAQGIGVNTTTTEAVLTANTCSENGGSGIAFLFGATGSAVDNTCSQNNMSGIAVRGWDSTPVLSKNRCVENKLNGIHFSAGCGGTAENNTCQQNKQWGILAIDEGTKPTIADDNTCTDNGDGPTTHAEGLPTSRQEQIDANLIGWLLAAEKFDDLERLASKLRLHRCLDQQGQWQLAEFYESLANGFDNGRKKDRVGYLETIERWRQAYPESITPRIVQALAHTNYGWDARGNGFAYTVTMDGWKVFKEELGVADQILREAMPLNKDDPHFYVAMVRVYIGNNGSRQEVDDAFAKGTAITPDYEPLYRSVTDYLLPRWHGSYSEIMEFADEAVERTRETRGEAMYAVIADELLCYEGIAGLMNYYDFPWPRLEQAYTEYLDRCPNTFSCQNSYCLISCYYDLDVARKMFDAIGNNWNKAFWSDEKYFIQHKMYAANASQPLPKPAAPSSPSGTSGFFSSILKRIMQFF